MTEYEKIKTIFTELQIPFEEKRKDSGHKLLIIVAGKEIVIGYHGFFCVYNFTADGKFINLGIWE